jgi:acetone monooxygenase (methyl acetate-forming)
MWMTQIAMNQDTAGTPGAQVLDAVVIGAGFGGIYQLYRLLKDGLQVRSFEAAGGVGGVWYWNRYPGARVDSHFPHYQYWFSKELWDEGDWKETFPAQPEIEQYINHVVDKFDLRRHITFNTRVTSAIYDTQRGTWTVSTDSGEQVVARFVIFNTGGLSEAKVPPFAGHDSFAGPSFHTSRWPREGVELKGKRVAVFGTAATGIQVIQTIAPIVAHLTVFQRTPNYAVAIRNPKIEAADLQWMRDSFESMRDKVRWSRAGFVFPDPPLFKDVPPEQREAHLRMIWESGNLSIWGNTFADFQVNPEAMACVTEFVRARIRERIADPTLAEKLIPSDYSFGTRRVPLENGYFEAFSRDNVTLVDLRAEPVEYLDAQGIKTSAAHYDVDLIIYATGFDAGVGAINKIDIRGVDGVSLRDLWTKSLTTTVGMQVHGFPNLFMTMAPFAPAAAICNVPVCIDQQCDWIADAIGFVREKGLTSIQPSAQTEAKWMAHHEAVSEPTLLAQNRNSWYRREAEDGSKRELIAYLGGIPNYRRVCDEMKASGFQGFELT